MRIASFGVFFDSHFKVHGQCMWYEVRDFPTLGTRSALFYYVSDSQLV